MFHTYGMTQTQASWVQSSRRLCPKRGLINTEEYNDFDSGVTLVASVSIGAIRQNWTAARLFA